MTRLRLAAAVAVCAVSLATAAIAEPTCPPGVPPGVGCGGPDLQLATAGTYHIDPNHTAVVARVPHMGYAYSVFRFGKVEGTLTWDPAAPANSTLKASVQTASIQTPVPGFALELSGEAFLKSLSFPQATFASTAFRQTSPTAGQVEGRFTLMGKTQPIVIDVQLVGAGSGYAGKPRLGIEGHTSIRPQDYGMPPNFDQPIKLSLDVEFEKVQ